VFGASHTVWPRYNTRAGLGGDTDTDGIGQTGYGCYETNVGTITASPYFTNRDSKHPNPPRCPKRKKTGQPLAARSLVGSMEVC